MNVNCYSCSQDTNLEAGSHVGRKDECPHCSRDMRCCRMCSFYDPKAYNECKEPSADRILEKEKANFCDYFKLGSPESAQGNKKSLLDAANSLFK